MIRIVLIDDDRNVREYIKTIIAETQDEFKIVGEAYDGSTGLEIIKDLLPDILILDIEMPSVNGIDLLVKLKNNNIMLRTLILSCHDDFHYVREAMKLGAAEYLLKHKIDGETLINTLHELKRKPLPFNSGTNTEYNWPAKFNLFLSGELSSDEYSKIASQFAQNNQNVIVCAIEIDYFQKIAHSNSQQYIESFEQDIWNALNSVKVSNFQSSFLRLKLGYYALLLVFEQYTSSSFTLRNDVYNLTSTYRKCILEKFRTSISIGISPPATGMHKLAKQWNSAQTALATKFYYGCNQSIFFEEIKPTRSFDSIKIKITELKSDVLPRENLLSLTESLFQEIDFYRVPAHQFQEFFLELINYILQIMSILNIELSDIFEQIEELTIIQDNLETLDDYRNWILKIINDIYNLKQKSSNKRIEINCAIDYVKHHYKEDITLEDISKYVGISKAYFSNMFKKETGQNFSIYLLNFRLEKAKELLLANDQSCLDIAYEVGFHSHTYFFNAFQKKYGMTPKTYRQQYLNS